MKTKIILLLPLLSPQIKELYVNNASCKLVYIDLNIPV